MAAIMMPEPMRSERGNALVEFALVLPLLMLVFAGIVDFGFLFQRYEVVTNAAREGARLAVLPGYPTESVRSRVNDYIREGLGDAAFAAGTVTVSVDTVPVTPPFGSAFNASRVTVTFRYDYLLLGFIVNFATGQDFGPDVTLRAVSAMRPEVSS